MVVFCFNFIAVFLDFEVPRGPLTWCPLNLACLFILGSEEGLFVQSWEEGVFRSNYYRYCDEKKKYGARQTQMENPYLPQCSCTTQEINLLGNK